MNARDRRIHLLEIFRGLKVKGTLLQVALGRKTRIATSCKVYFLEFRASFDRINIKVCLALLLAL
jgi:hypothetical protein